MSTDWQQPTDNIYPLLDCILENIPAPEQLEGTPQMLVTSLDYSSYTGRIAVMRTPWHIERRHECVFGKA